MVRNVAPNVDDTETLGTASKKYKKIHTKDMRLTGIMIDDASKQATIAQLITANNTSEINALTEKTSIAAGDLFIIEDSAASNAKKKLLQSTLVASQTDMETGTSLTTFVTPGKQYFHPSACKGWGKATGAGSLTVGYNMDAVTDTGTGRLGVNITLDMSSANYAIVSSVESVATSLAVASVDNGGLIYNASPVAGSFGIWNYDDTATTHVAQDPQSYFWAIFGDGV